MKRLKPWLAPHGLAVVPANGSVLGQQCDPSRGRVTHDESIERIPRPRERPGGSDHGGKALLVLHQAERAKQLLEHSGCIRLRAANLMQVFKLKSHDGGDTKLLAFKPSLHSCRKTSQIPGVEPNNDVRVEMNHGRQESDQSRWTRSSGSPLMKPGRDASRLSRPPDSAGTMRSILPRRSTSAGTPDSSTRSRTLYTSARNRDAVSLPDPVLCAAVFIRTYDLATTRTSRQGHLCQSAAGCRQTRSAT